MKKERKQGSLKEHETNKFVWFVWFVVKILVNFIKKEEGSNEGREEAG